MSTSSISFYIELGAERNGGKSLGFTTGEMAPCTQGRTSVSHQMGRTSVEGVRQDDGLH